MTNRDPALLSEAERRVEIAQILAAGYARHALARDTNEARVRNTGAEVQESPDSPG